MSIMKLNNYAAKIDYDPELDQFRGEILGLNGGADFYGKSPAELRREFKKSLQEFLAVCEEKGVEPVRNFSGKFNVRVSEELHSQIFYQAASTGKSINQWINEALSKSVEYRT